jgi:hypothetical protein
MGWLARFNGLAAHDEERKRGEEDGQAEFRAKGGFWNA